MRVGEPGAAEVFTQRLDNLNLKYESLVQLLSQRLRTAIEVSGAEGLVRESSSCRYEFYLGKKKKNNSLKMMRKLCKNITELCRNTSTSIEDLSCGH